MATPMQDTVNAVFTGKTYIYSLTYDPSTRATGAYAGTIALGVGTISAVKGKMWQKQDDGKTTNWILVSTGALKVRGTWNAGLNLPNLITTPMTQGDFWIVNANGNTNLGGITNWIIGDWAVFLGGVSWAKVDNTDIVVSVNGETGIVNLYGSDIPNDSLVAGLTVADALNTLLSGGGASSGPYVWYDIQPADGKVLPIAQPRAYYPCVLYNATPMFFDGTSLRKYVAYYGAAASAQGYAAFSDDGKTWDTETLVTGVLGLNYHVTAIVISGIIHYFYWNTTASIYSAGAVRHATFNPAISCVAATSDAAITGGYIYGASGSGNLRAGTYGFTQVFYNTAPTSLPANPYSYPWCAIVQATDGSQESCLFATSADGYSFAPWNALQEVIPRNPTGWDRWIGTVHTWIDSVGLWHSFYAGGLGTSGGEDTNFGGGLGYATSLDGITWTKYILNPIIRKTDGFKSWKRLYTPWIIKDIDGYWVYFSCKNNAGTYVVARAKVGGWL